MFNAQLTEYIKRLKSEKKLSNQQIAVLSGVSESTVGRLIKGEMKGADFSTVTDVISALGGSLDEACGIIPTPPPIIADAKTSGNDSYSAEMTDYILSVYTRSVREDIISTYNTRVAEYSRVCDARIESEEKHYNRLIKEVTEMHQHRIDNLMHIIDARSKTINKLLMVIGALGFCLIALLVVILVVPTNSILNW